MSGPALSDHDPLTAVFLPDGDSMFDPKWLVIGFALSAVALVANYDLRFGFAAGVLLFVAAAIYLSISVWLSPGSDEPVSERAAMSKRFARLSRNRRAARAKELGAKGGPDAG